MGPRCRPPAAHTLPQPEPEPLQDTLRPLHREAPQLQCQTQRQPGTGALAPPLPGEEQGEEQGEWEQQD